MQPYSPEPAPQPLSPHMCRNTHIPLFITSLAIHCGGLCVAEWGKWIPLIYFRQPSSESNPSSYTTHTHTQTGQLHNITDASMNAEFQLDQVARDRDRDGESFCCPSHTHSNGCLEFVARQEFVWSHHTSAEPQHRQTCRFCSTDLFYQKLILRQCN